MAIRPVGPTELLLDTSVTVIVGVVTEYGRGDPADDRTGSFVGSPGSIVTTNDSFHE